MSKAKVPLFSFNAIGTIGKTLTYKKKLQTNTVSKYSKPGSKSPFESSPRQKDQRGILGLITIRWSCMTPLEQAPWEILAKKSRKPLSGYHLFLHTAKTDLFQYLGLVGYWSMNYNLNNSIPDLSGNSNHGILSPDYPSDGPILCDSINPRFGKSIKLDGINDWLDCGNNPILNNLREITYEFYFCQHDILQTAIFFNEYPKYIYSTGTSRLISTFDATIQYAATISLTEYLPDTWYHLVCTYSDTGDRKIHFHLNGVEVDYHSQTPAEGTMLPDDEFPLTIGAFPDGSLPFNGKFDEARIWNRILGSTEIKKHYDLFRP